MRTVQCFAAVLTVAVAVTASAAEPGSRERMFLRALEQFDAAQAPSDYKDAAKLLDSLARDGFHNGAVYYNLGNAWFRAGEYGRAIAAYRRAKPFRPRDPYLEANLRQALQRAPGRVTEPAAPWWSHLLFWNRWLSYSEKAYGAFVACAAAVVVCVCAELRGRRQWRWVVGGCTLVSLLLAVDATLTWREITASRRGVVVVETTARKGTAKDYEPAFDQPLQEGAEFTTLAASGDWVFAHFEGVGDGWLRREDVDVGQDSGSK